MGDPTVSLRKCTIRELEPFVRDTMLLCIIIAKNNPRKVQMKFDSSERGVWNFTVRDSPFDYVNVTYWGSAHKTFMLNERFHIGDVVQIQRAQVEIRQMGDSNEQYHPMVTSPFKLTLSENESEMILITDGHFEHLQRVLHLPTKPIANYVAIADVHNNVQSLEGQSVDLLVAVRNVGDMRTVNTRFGEKQVRTLTVFDHTNPALNVSLWEPEYIARATVWKPRLTILFMTDMKISYDSYQKNARASLSIRTIVTEDPICVEADNLRNFAKDAPIAPSAMLDQLALSIPDPRSIRTVMNVRQINEKIELVTNALSARPEDQQFTALVYAAVTELDLDGIYKVVSTRCVRCKSIIQNSNGMCENANCVVGMGAEQVQPETSFDVRLTMSDHTGSLVRCRLNGKYAEEVFGCKVEEFLAMTDEQKAMMKWKFLMERCELRLVVLCTKTRGPLLSVLTCNLANPLDLINRL